jgi:PAS domain S-box-containing protein
MALKREITAKIKELLGQNPKGLSITQIVNKIAINRNTAGRYLENLTVSGQVEMRQFGMAKIYRLAQRVPLSAMLSISSELIMLLDNSLRIIYANEPMYRFLGTTQEELYGKNIEFSPCVTVFDDAFEALKKHLKAGLTGREWKGEMSLANRDMIFSCRIAPAVFEEGQRGVSVLLEDITDRKRAEEALRQSEATARALINAPTDSVFLLDSTGIILELNETAARRLGRPKDELLGVLADTFLPEEIAQARRSIISQAIERKKAIRFEDERGGKWFDTVAYPIISDGGEVNKIAIISRDITDRKRAEEILRGSEERYRSLVEASQDLIFVVGPDDVVIYVNSFAAAMLGKEPRDIIGMTRASLFPPDLSDRQTAGLHRVFQTGQTIRSDGPMSLNREIRWFDHFLTPIVDTGGRVISVLGVSRDITERKLAEEALRRRS